MPNASTSANAGLSPARGLAGLGMLTVLTAVVLFGMAGTVRWPFAWAYLALTVAFLVLYAGVMLRLHPDLIAERKHPPADAKAWDRPFVAILGVAGPTAMLLLCGLDYRLGWSQSIGPRASFAGLLILAAGGALSTWAVASNRFFSAVVRIQRDRGHHVVDSGPYRFVRHPSYVGSILHLVGTSLALASWPGLGLGLLLAVLFVVRTALEDTTLLAELEGYADYARRVRFRLVPGVW